MFSTNWPLLPLVVILAAANPCQAQSLNLSLEYTELLSRLDAQEAQLRELRARLDSPDSPPLVEAAFMSCPCNAPPPVRRLPVVVELPDACASSAANSG